MDERRTIVTIGKKKEYKYPECEACLRRTGGQHKVPTLNDGMVVANDCACCADHKRVSGVTD